MARLARDIPRCRDRELRQFFLKSFQEAELEKVRASLPLFANVELGNTWGMATPSTPTVLPPHVRLSTCA